MSKKINRLTLEELPPQLRDVLRPRVERLGYLGEFFRCAGHQPHVLTAFMQMTESLKQALPERLSETGALTVAMLMGNRYELHQHEQLSRKLGFGEDWVAAVEQLAPDTALMLSDDERAVQRLVIALVERRGKEVAAELEDLIDRIGPNSALAVMFLAGRYVTHAMIVNGLDLAPPVESIFAESWK